MTPDAVMVFAAGFGTRMGALTKHRPKPLIEVAGKPLISYSLQLARQAGLHRIVVNSHYHAEQLESYLSGHPDVTTLRETPDILETGGGLRNALPLLNSNPVFTLNSDMVWTGDNPLTALAKGWDGARMDALLMLIPTQNVAQNTSPGDFFLDETGRIDWRGKRDKAPFMYTGAQIIKTDLLDQFAEKTFSLTAVWDKMIQSGRVFGLVHSGGWVDIGQPERISVAEAALQRNDFE